VKLKTADMLVAWGRAEMWLETGIIANSP
jgi:hypothetical protein